MNTFVQYLRTFLTSKTVLSNDMGVCTLGMLSIYLPYDSICCRCM